MRTETFPVVWVERRSLRKLGWWGSLWTGVLGAGLLTEYGTLAGLGALRYFLAEYWPYLLALLSLQALAWVALSRIVEPRWMCLSEAGVGFGRRAGSLTPWTDLSEGRPGRLGGVILRSRRVGAFRALWGSRRLDADQWKALINHPLCPRRLRFAV